MSLSITEFNEAIKLSEKLASNIGMLKGIAVLSKPYKMYDGVSGIEFNVYDCRGCYYKTYYTGRHNDIFELIQSLRYQVARIISEC